MKRRDVRELVIKALFACALEKGEPLRQLAYIVDDWEMAGFDEGRQDDYLTGEFDQYARRLTGGIWDHKDELDGLIDAYAKDWELSRLGWIERTILRMGLYEMMHDEKLPPAIAINEALELVKIYGNPEASGFVNGILGKKAEELKKGPL